MAAPEREAVSPRALLETPLPGPRHGPPWGYVAPELCPPACRSASDPQMALSRPVGEVEGGELVHGEAGQPVTCKTLVYLRG